MIYIPYTVGSCRERLLAEDGGDGYVCHHVGCGMYMKGCDGDDFPVGCPYRDYDSGVAFRYVYKYGEPPGNG